MANDRCDKCQRVAYPLTPITLRGSICSMQFRLCHDCHSAMLSDGTVTAEPSREGSDWLIMPANCAKRMLFARWLRQNGRISEHLAVGA